MIVDYEIIEYFGIYRRVPRYTAEGYIKYEPKQVDYCEAVILEDGSIVDAYPGHTLMMVHLALKGTDLTEDDLSKSWFTEDLHYRTKAIAMYPKFQIATVDYEDLPDAQKHTLKVLESDGRIEVNVNKMTSYEYYVSTVRPSEELARLKMRE